MNINTSIEILKNLRKDWQDSFLIREYDGFIDDDARECVEALSNAISVMEEMIQNKKSEEEKKTMTNEEAIGIILKEKEDHVEGSIIDEAFCKAVEALKVVFQENKAMTNADYCRVHDIKFRFIQPCMQKKEYGGGYYFRNKETGEKIGQISEISASFEGRPLDAHGAFKAWLDMPYEVYKEPEPILTGEERGYLKQVIRPFRDEIEGIYIEHERSLLTIIVREKGDVFYTTLCVGSVGDGFQGMKDYERYSLQELGL